MHFKFKMDILLYSKFSNASKQLMKQLQQTPELLESITITCIDNKMIRKQIVSDEKVKINYLPCFIRLNEQTGNFDIYEGKNAFDFFSTLQEQIMQQYQPEPYQAQPPPQPIPQPAPQPIPQPPPQQKRRPIPPVQTSVQPPVQTIKQKAQEAENQRNQYELKDTKIKEEFITKQTKNLKKNLSTPVKNVTFTPISELGLDNLQDVNELSKNNENKGGKDEDEDEVEDEGDYGGEEDDGEDASLKENQPTSISTYTHISKNSNSEFSEREVQSKQAEINASKNTGSILAKAMKMQKERN
jgi:hypothetical protein